MEYITLTKLWGYCGDEFCDYGFLSCCIVQFCRRITAFRISMLPPSSGLKCIRRRIGSHVAMSRFFLYQWKFIYEYESSMIVTWRGNCKTNVKERHSCLVHMLCIEKLEHETSIIRQKEHIDNNYQDSLTKYDFVPMIPISLLLIQ
jgi:hypothetical protein